MDKLKEALKVVLKEIKEERFQEDRVAKEKYDGDRKSLLENIGKDMGSVFEPFLAEMKKHSQMSAEEMRRIIVDAVQVEAPSVDTTGLENALLNAFQNMKLPTPQIKVDVPPFVLPEDMRPQPVNFPAIQRVLLDSVDMRHPIPVMMVDLKGNPYFPAIPAGSGNSGPRVMAINDFRTPAGDSMVDEDNDALKVSGSFSLLQVSGAVDSVNIVQSITLETRQVSGAMDSVAVVDIFGSTSASGVFNADNRIRVSVETGGSGLTDAELRAASLLVQQVSGAIDSVNVVGFTSSVATVPVNTEGLAYNSDNPLPVTLAASTTIVRQVSGAEDSVMVNNPKGEGEAAVALRVLQAGDAVSSVSIASSVVSLEVKQVSGASSSVVASGDVAHDTGDSGNPVKVGGQARTTNPTAVADSDRINFTGDKLGRQLMRPYQVRELISTAYVSVSNGTETTLKAAVAGSYLDLLYIMGANQSSAAVQVDIRGVTAGNILMTLYIPANSVAGVALPIPFPQDETGNNWTVDLPDVTGTTVNVSALFSNEK